MLMLMVCMFMLMLMSLCKPALIIYIPPFWTSQRGIAASLNPFLLMRPSYEALLSGVVWGSVMGVVRRSCYGGCFKALLWRGVMRPCYGGCYEALVWGSYKVLLWGTLWDPVVGGVMRPCYGGCYEALVMGGGCRMSLVPCNFARFTYQYQCNFMESSCTCSLSSFHLAVVTVLISCHLSKFFLTRLDFFFIFALCYISTTNFFFKKALNYFLSFFFYRERPWSFT